MRNVLWILASSLLLAGLSGCAAASKPGTISSLEKVPPDAPSEVGKGDFPIMIRVVEESGEGPIVMRAPVLIQWIENPILLPSISELRTRNATHAARTDATGHVLAHLDEGKTYAFLATAPGFTLEARHPIKLTNEYRTRPVVIALFREATNLTVQGTFPTTAHVAKIPFVCCPGEPIWIPQNLTFHSDAGSQRQYTFRLSAVEAKITWNNTLTQYADLGVRFGLKPDVYWDGDKPTTLDPPLPATYEERLTIPHEQLAFASGHKDAVARIGAFTRAPVVAASPLAYTIQVHAEFSTEPVDPVKPASPFYAPGFGAISATLGLALLAFAVAVRRR